MAPYAREGSLQIFNARELVVGLASRFSKAVRIEMADGTILTVVMLRVWEGSTVRRRRPHTLLDCQDRLTGRVMTVSLDEVVEVKPTLPVVAQSIARRLLGGGEPEVADQEAEDDEWSWLDKIG